ncbi:MAG: TIGR02301 family protein [Hoeflea sp.]|uniref:TIGR02301 family protein n=1 Tax=Hoeflea sp. TaxID=1940281 RepID=UPI000C10D0EA|nr:TIGR02301 family protein [Hoeflea sp.]PHR20079.1 MAG: TIGR02301 family protein [Hoeflea sp.]|tara:strand:+ start:38503 stop:38928 length:426 start_codon:yes stop_codon:yes gene_type:complete
MTHRLFLMLALLTPFVLTSAQGIARAQETTEDAVVSPDLPPPPYEARLLRLAEIIGSIQYLRNLCNPEGENGWRESMQALLDSETAGEPGRREQLTAGYNRGFRAFASVYTDCTPSAVVAEERYRYEGATLITEIVARYGN